MIHEQTAYLCGYFTRTKEISDTDLIQHGWTREQVEAKDISNAKRLFYSEFVDFCYGEDTAYGCKAWQQAIDRHLTLEFKGRRYDYELVELAVYLMPMQMTLFSIKIRQATDDLNALTATMFSLRTVDLYSPEVHQSFIDAAITPVKDVYGLLTGHTEAPVSALVENGNKLRLYQVINTTDEASRPADDAERDLLLYQLGTLSRVTKPGETDDYAVAPQYLERTIEENRVKVFCNWDALALMDTFTLHAYGASAPLVDNWQGTYFRMIYLHALFQKCYLFNLNARFRASLRKKPSTLDRLLSSFNIGGSEVGTLVDEYETFERWCCFHKISYNFLPLEIDQAIDKGLEIGEERQQLADVLDKEKTRRDEANDKMVNTLLFCLSLLTLFSAIWDLSCLLDQMYPYADYLGSTILGYRTVTLLVLLLLVVVLYLIFHRRKR